MDAEYKILSLCKYTELVFFTDGSYTLRYTDAPEKYSDTSSFSLIQCYSNGCINKVPVDNLLALRYDYKYSHGIYPLSNLLASSIVSVEDNISVTYMRNGTEHTASIDVPTLRSHSMLGLKGVKIIGTFFDEITGWYVNDDLISRHSENKKPINPNEQTVSGNIAADASNVISDLLKVENNDELKELFSSYLKSGKNIPIGQKYAKEVLARCQTREEFWHVINTLFKCDTRIYRTPVVEYLNDNDISQFMPSIEFLSPICEQLFSVTAKPEKNLEFLYHFKDILTDEVKDKLIRSTNSLSQPSLYFKLCDTLEMNTTELIEYCIKQSNAASYYCIYETLLKVHKKRGYIAVSKLIHEGESANVQIVYADQTYNTLYATQKELVDYKKITKIPLLNIGDIIEISFDIYGNPVPHKCYKKIKVYLKSYTREIEIEYKERYKAKVIRQTSDKYHYLLKIIE